MSWTRAGTLRTIVLFVVFVPVIVYLLHYAYQKHKQSPVKTQACKRQCLDEGYDGYDFQWEIFSAPKCSCLNS